MIILMFVMLGVQPVQVQNVTDNLLLFNSVDYPIVSGDFEGWWLIPLILLPAILWAINLFDQPKKQRFTNSSRQAFDLAYYHDLRPRRKFKSRISAR